MQETVRSLHGNGFVVCRGVLSNKDIENGTSCINVNSGAVNYVAMEKFIRGIMLSKVQTLLGLCTPIDFVKYRVSDNNNSADAAGFHRDLICKQSGRRQLFMPCFTCLTYFDATVLEVIPGSHMYTYALHETASLYQQKARVHMQPGDILLFYSSLLHRGVFTEGIPRRRLIQVFEVFLNPTFFRVFTPLILHIPGDETFSDWMVQASKKSSLLVNIINTYGFLNAATGYGSPENIERCTHGIRFLFLSSEGLRGRLIVRPDTWQPINKYIINPNVPTFDLPPHCVHVYKYYVFHRQYCVYTVILVFYIIALIYVIQMIITRYLADVAV